MKTKSLTQLLSTLVANLLPFQDAQIVIEILVNELKSCDEILCCEQLKNDQKEQVYLQFKQQELCQVKKNHNHTLIMPLTARDKLVELIQVTVRQLEQIGPIQDMLNVMAYDCSLLLDKIAYTQSLFETNEALGKLNTQLKIQVQEESGHAVKAWEMADEIIGQSQGNVQLTQLCHEVNNIICIAKMDQDILQKSLKSLEVSRDVEIKESLSKTGAALDRMAALMQAEKTGGDRENLPQISELDKVLDTIENLFKSAFKLEDIRFKLTRETKKCQVKMTELHLYQILINLIKNSIEALKNRHSKCIDLTVKQKEGHLYLEIKDNGEGFRECDINQQIIKSTKKGHLGVGLSIVTDILRQSNAEISRKPVEKGSHQMIRIPCA